MSIRYPDGNVLLRNLNRDYPVVSRGEGIYLFDETGKRWLDGSSGALVSSVGHGNKEVAARIGEQLAQVAYVNGTHFTSRVTEEAASRLASKAPKGLDRAAFLGSGSEAIEAAIKFARQLWVERGQPQRSKIIARTPGYHGNTLYALSASGRPHYKKWFGPLLSDVVTTEAPYGYRSPVADYEKDGADYYARKLEEAIVGAGADTVAAFLFETVVGSSAGASTPPAHYYARISEVCRKHGVLLIADEVMCGAGRTGRFFALEHYGLEPDIVVMGKGVSGGYVPASVVMVRNSALAEMKAGSGGFMHAQTYLQAPAMTASIVATLDYFDTHDVVGNAQRVGAHMQAQLRTLMKHPSVGNVSGIGMLAGVEFVADKASKAPYPRAQKKIEGFVQQCFEDGLILWPNTGQANGTDGDLVMVGPPLIATTAQIDELTALLERNIVRYFER